MIHELDNIPSSNYKGTQRNSIKWKVFIKGAGQVSYLSKERKRLFQTRTSSFLRGREQQEFYHVDCLFFLFRMERASQADYLIGADQKIPKQLIKITFLLKVGNTVKSDIESRFGIMPFSQVTPLWACVFSSTAPTVLDPQHLTECLASGRLSVNIFECWHNLIQASNDIVR